VQRVSAARRRQDGARARVSGLGAEAGGRKALHRVAIERAKENAGRSAVLRCTEHQRQRQPAPGLGRGDEVSHHRPGQRRRAVEVGDHQQRGPPHRRALEEVLGELARGLLHPGGVARALVLTPGDPARLGSRDL
jgi:hypothetical protein